MTVCLSYINKPHYLSLATMKFVIAYLLLVISNADAIAQPANAIKGKIVNGETGAAISNPSVFITNTSKGTVSSSNGEFELVNVPLGTYDLVVSCISFETQAYTYTSIQLPLNMKIQLKPKADELQAVIIEPYEKDGWEKWGKFFLDNFIGSSSNAQQCTIKNYTALHFRNSKNKNLLTVTADEPLIIENKALGYKIKYQLEGFSFNFNNGTLLYYGYTLFNDLDGKPPKQNQLKNREKAYNGSIQHFMSGIYNNRLAEDGFEVKRLVKTPNLEKQRVKSLYRENHINNKPKDSSDYYEKILRQPDMLEKYGERLLTGDSLLISEATASIKKIFFPDYLYITYKNEKEDAEYLRYIHENRPAYYQHSVVFLLNNKAISIDPMGNYYMPQDFMSYGYWSWSEKIATMLPLDYK
jgi:CarboxypepD_reg-like domain